VTLVLVSVDTPEVSLPWAEKKGFTFPMASDPEQKVIQGWGLQNPDATDLALHAVYILDKEGKIFYRKIARRRAYSKEFIAAIDYHYGR
jgi:peroxiredoxin